MKEKHLQGEGETMAISFPAPEALSRTRYLRLVAAAAAVVATALAAPLQAQAAPVTTVVSSGNFSTPITDAAWVVVGQSATVGFTIAPLNVPDLGTIVDVNVRLRASHTYVGDLGVFLGGPDDTSITLVTPLGDDSGDNFGTGANDCTGTPTILDDAAAAPIGDGQSTLRRAVSARGGARVRSTESRRAGSGTSGSSICSRVTPARSTAGSSRSPTSRRPSTCPSRGATRPTRSGRESG